MSFLMENTGDYLRRVLVLEPYDINWLGIKPIIEATFGNRILLVRISDTDKLAETALHYQVDSILLSAVGHHIDMLSLLRQLSKISRYHQHFQIAAYLRNELPHLEDLLLAFGVNVVFREGIDAVNTFHYLVPGRRAFRPGRLTPQEQNVAQALLAGQTVTRVAQLMHRDIRTISSHKRALLAKLKMTGSGELQVLGGSLMAGGGLA